MGILGADRIDAGTDFDRADNFGEGLADATVVLQGDLEGVGVGGPAEGDVLVGIGCVVGTQVNDLIAGDDRADDVDGFQGMDAAKGGGGADALRGAGTLEGGPGSDTLTGGVGADTLGGGAKDDHVEGGRPGPSGPRDVTDAASQPPPGRSPQPLRPDPDVRGVQEAHVRPLGARS